MFVLRAIALAAVMLVAPFGTGGAETFRLVTGDQYEPFADRDLPAGGLATDLIKRVLERDGHTVEIVWDSWNRGRDQTEQGIYDGAFPWTWSDARAETLAFSDPVFEIHRFYYVRKGRFQTVASFDQVEDGLYCNPMGYAVPAAVQASVKAGRMYIESADEIDHCYLMIRRDRVDMMRLNDALFSFTMGRMGLDPDGFDVMPLAPEISRLHLVVGKHAGAAGEALLDIFNAALRRARADGFYDQINERHVR